MRITWLLWCQAQQVKQWLKAEEKPDGFLRIDAKL